MSEFQGLIDKFNAVESSSRTWPSDRTKPLGDFIFKHLKQGAPFKQLSKERVVPLITEDALVLHEALAHPGARTELFASVANTFNRLAGTQYTPNDLRKILQGLGTREQILPRPAFRGYIVPSILFVAGALTYLALTSQDDQTSMVTLLQDLHYRCTPSGLEDVERRYGCVAQVAGKRAGNGQFVYSDAHLSELASYAQTFID